MTTLGPPNTGRQQAQRLYPTLGVCAECEHAPARERHHWDGDTANNAPTNVVPLCSLCHHRIHGRHNEAEMARLTAAASRWRQAKTHCVHGHPLSGDNLYPTASGRRRCRACALAYAAASWARRRAR